MNYLHDNLNFDTKEAALEMLKEAVALRNKMGGALYYGIMHEDCEEIASKAMNYGVTYSECAELLKHD